MFARLIAFRAAGVCKRIEHTKLRDTAAAAIQVHSQCFCGPASEFQDFGDNQP